MREGEREGEGSDNARASVPQLDSKVQKRKTDSQREKGGEKGGDTGEKGEGEEVKVGAAGAN